MKKNKKKETKKRRKLRIDRVLFVLLIVALIALLIYLVLNITIKNVYISPLKNITEKQVLDTLFTEEYPKFFSVSSSKIKQQLKEAFPIIKDVKVKRGFFDNITLEIKEHQILFIYDNQYVFEDGTSLNVENYDYYAPTLIVSDDVTLDQNLYQSFIQNLSLIDKNILDKISEISYSPNGEKDPGRFILIMSDGNYVYTTVTKLYNLDMYDTVKRTSEGKRGILKIDSLREEDQGIPLQYLE